MRVLALTHGPSVGPGVFEDAVRDAGHELVEQQVPVDGAPTVDADAVIVLGGAMHPDEEERHGWLRPELEYLGGLLERGVPMLGVCLGSQLIARAAGASVFRSAEPEVGWLPVELTEAAATDPVRRRCRSASKRFSGTTTRTTFRRAPSSLRGAASARRRSASGGPGASSSTPRCEPAQVEAWLSEDPDDVADPPALRAATRERIEGWNDLGRGLCTAFLAAV